MYWDGRSTRFNKNWTEGGEWFTSTRQLIPNDDSDGDGGDDDDDDYDDDDDDDDDDDNYDDDDDDDDGLFGGFQERLRGVGSAASKSFLAQNPNFSNQPPKPSASFLPQQGWWCLWRNLFRKCRWTMKVSRGPFRKSLCTLKVLPSSLIAYVLDGSFVI